MVESAVSGERAALPPPGPPSRQIGRPSDQNRAALLPKVGGHPLKSGGPIHAHRAAGPPRLGRRAVLRAATLKLRAARMWPPLGLWAAHGGRGGAHGAWQQASRQRASEGGRRRIGRIGRIERFDALNALRTIAFEGSSPRARKRAAKAYCGTERQASSHGRGGGGTRVPPGRCVRQHALRQQRRPPAWQTRSSELERCAV